MKGYLKRNFTPASWLVKRKERKYIVKPSPGGQSLEFGLPLNIILKDLGYADTTKEVKKILESNEVLVDGKKRKDHKFLVGVMDILSLPTMKKNYMLVLNKKGKLKMVELGENESKTKIAKVVGKTILEKGKTQLNLHDGKNVLSEEKCKVGDSLVLELPSLKVTKVLELKKGAYVYLLKGKYVGGQGVLEEIEGSKIIYSSGKEKIETMKAYAFVIGEKEPLVKIKND